MTDAEFQQNLIEKFKKLDADSDGNISFNEYQEAFKEFSEKTLEDLWNYMNKDKDGFISFEEFKTP
ncbi:EF-hand domain-containing protein [Pseudomonas sp. R1-1]|uniref:EF-hand domain-containing protein n=1 Tax=Pseudomonas sp. R1-1 TaxID=1602529 RepID=UPI003DA89145